ncbi:hypothetical protein HGM15179_022417 [Zosterops borbonicus]|uniref:Uncharacterized protein n=1 Tax=Zosterops borbonicus TaxID=364589 RepID=A0A8K1FWH3_9PASS|nr:hypothetical protein HGM15179_022417 [Zosterops borbonicus]
MYIGFTQKAITAATSTLSVNNIWASPPPIEEIEMQHLPPLEEDDMDPEDFIPEAEEEVWPTDQDWFKEVYPPTRYY